MKSRTLRHLVESLNHTHGVILAAVSDLHPDQAQWRPDIRSWSILQILNHMADEEVEDFRTRLRLTLSNPDEAWPPIAPERAATERNYQERPWRASIDRFREERQASLDWLRTIDMRDPCWGNVHHHKLGDLSAGDLLASWAAHDLLHLRQITKRRHEMLCHFASPLKAAYAGSW